MKGPVLAPSQQDMIMENRITLSPRNSGNNDAPGGGRNAFSKKGSSRRSNVAVGDPWSETAASSPISSPTTGSTTIVIPQSVANDITSSPRNSEKSSTQRETPIRSRTSSKGTAESNAHGTEPQSTGPPGSPSPGKRHRFKELPPAQHVAQKERPKEASGLLPLSGSSTSNGIQRRVRDPIEQEQALFEQRLCEDFCGVAVRKINQYGKSNLRYVKCVHVDDLNDACSSKRSISSRSASTKGRRKTWHHHDARKDPQSEKARYALIWGKKKDIQITLDHFIAVRIGKGTERARRNPLPASRILSLLTNDPNHPALDIEAPSRMDRDKFARAFARFLDVPLEGDDSQSVHSAEFTPVTHKTTSEPSASSSVPGDFSTDVSGVANISPSGQGQSRKGEGVVPVTPNDPQNKDIGGFWQGAVAAASGARDSSYQSASNQTASMDGFNLKAVVEMPSEKESAEEDKDNDSAVSSLTGHGYDQELVEELHSALNELRVELEDSRAEAARAVKVAEQAIQSAEKTSSQDWNNTVTHKAAEAAAQAQKRSAEAIAKQRLAEERLENERKTAAFWRKQAEAAEEEAGALQTKAAAAEVQKSAIIEQLQGERSLSKAQIESLKDQISRIELGQLKALQEVLEKNRNLEMELDALRQEPDQDKDRNEDVENVGGRRRNPISGRKKKNEKVLESLQSKGLSDSMETDMADHLPIDSSNHSDMFPTDELDKLKAETALMRQQYEKLRQTTTTELAMLPEISKQLTHQVTGSLEVSQAEIERLRTRLAMESASRRKLLTEVQDLRGIVRVYCRPRPPASEESVFTMPSQETIVLRRDTNDKRKRQPMSFEFDRIFEPNLPQQDVYGEVQEVCLGVLDGFNITIMAFGAKGCGKTMTILGEVGSNDGNISITDHGIQLQALKQLFTIAEHRSERFKDTFSLSIVEVHDDRLSDLLVGTTSGDAKGHVVVSDSASRRKSQKHKQSEDDASSGKAAKLEIRSDLHGETVVQGALAIELENFDEMIRTWVECLANRRRRLEEQEMDIDTYVSSSHVITTLKVTSANIATGHGVVGKLQFVDMAAAELTRHSGELDTKESAMISVLGEGLRFTNRSLETLAEVAVARSQFVRSVPYRNSTLTHLLRDSLDGDTKVLFFACVSSEAADVQNTAATLRLASRMRQISIGKATKHSLTSP